MFFVFSGYIYAKRNGLKIYRSSVDRTYNKVDRLISFIRRWISPIWDPLEDPNAMSEPLFDVISSDTPLQLSHDTSLNLKEDQAY